MRQKITLSVILLLFLVSFEAHPQSRRTRSYIGIGVEADPVPFLTGGYFGSAWYGYGRLRGRLIVANRIVPRIFIPSGFSNNKVQQYSVHGDYFLQNNNFEALWISLGAEFNDGSVEYESTGETAEYTNYVINLGIGYNWKFYRDFYLNPWFGLHGIAAGDTKVQVGDEEFNPPTITPELTLKIGWHLRIKPDTKWHLRSR